MGKSIFYGLMLFLLPALAVGQSIGNYQSGFSRKDNTFSFTTTGGKVKIDLCDPAVFRVRASWNDQFEADEHLMVIKYNWAVVSATVKDLPGHFLIATSKLDIKVFKAPFQIEVYTKSGKLLSSEKLSAVSQEKGGKDEFVGGTASKEKLTKISNNRPGNGLVSKEKSVEGRVSKETLSLNMNFAISKTGNAVSCTKIMQADEHFFGFGERMDFLDRRNKKVTLNVGRGKGLPHAIGAYNILEANYSPVPFFMSTRGYGLFLHNSFATEWDMGASEKGKYTFKAVDGEMDYYFFYGPDFPSILDHYTALTGKSPMLPDFALGLHAGTYSGGTWGHEEMTSSGYVVALAKKYRDMGIPVDLLWLDSTWRLFGENGGKGATSFEWRETFKDPKSMFDSIYAMNYKMVGLHIRPRFDNAKKLKLLDQAREKGYTYPENGKPGEFVDFFNKEAADWWWNNGVMRVAAIGARFLKTDEGSAFGALANESEKVGPTGKAAERLHNVYPLVYAKEPFEQFEQYNKMRGLNQTREGYSGIQRYPYIFAGDWPSEWQYFAPVIKAGLNIGLSGVGSWAHCMGGFEHPADPELYIRWVQFGMFSPIAMVFGMDHSGYKEPWNYGEDALRNFKNYDLLRYRMIPYLYTNMYQQYKTGMPMMRALVLGNQDDENTYDIADQYMLGDQLMVCPVTTKGAVTRSVYLPKGVWFNYWTGEEMNGGKYVHVVAPLDTIPLFVKGGGIIPMQPQMIYSGEKPVDVITLDIFPKGKSDFQLYEDDGKSVDYQKKSYAITSIKVQQQTGGLQLAIAKPAGDFRPAVHTYMAKIHWNGQKPSGIAENGKKLDERTVLPNGKSNGWYYDPAAKIVWIATSGNNKSDIDLKIN